MNEEKIVISLGGSLIVPDKIDTDFSNLSFGEVVDSLQTGKTGAELRKVSPTNGMQEFINSNSDLYNSAKTQKYEVFSKIYLDKDSLVDDKKQDKDEESKKGSKRDDLIKHLFKIQHNIFLYNSKQFNEFIRKTEYKISSIANKAELKDQIEKALQIKIPDSEIKPQQNQLTQEQMEERLCPTCKNNLVFAEGCNLCIECGYSGCISG